jgi:hypothetical protein
MWELILFMSFQSIRLKEMQESHEEIITNYLSKRKKPIRLVGKVVVGGYNNLHGQKLVSGKGPKAKAIQGMHVLPI